MPLGYIGVVVFSNMFYFEYIHGKREAKMIQKYHDSLIIASIHCLGLSSVFAVKVEEAV